MSSHVRSNGALTWVRRTALVFAVETKSRRWRQSHKSCRTVPRFAINYSALGVAVFVATTAITLWMLFVPSLLGIEQMDIGITIARMVDPSSTNVSLERVAWHVLNSVVFILAYALTLLYLRKQSTPMTGLTFGLILWLAGPMLLIPALLDLHPQVASGELRNPGLFMYALGHGMLPASVDLGAHLLHGAVTGMLYKHVVL